MFRVITGWNLVRPDIELEDEVREITLRGYSLDAYLTGRFRAAIENGEIRPLSVSDIADFYCPSRRDLYLKKGKNRPSGVGRKRTWGQIAGHVVEKFVFTAFDEFRDCTTPEVYPDIAKIVDEVSADFRAGNKKAFQKLNEDKGRPDEEPDWLQSLLAYNGRAELGLKLLHEKLFNANSDIDTVDLESGVTCRLQPQPKEIGISTGAEPDFLIENCGVVGDVKSGIGGFRDFYVLTCAGYALAYENEKGSGHDINFGVIYFFPTRTSEYARHISLAQIHIFPIDDSVRRYFLQVRNAAYDTVSKYSLPGFPDNKDRCPVCEFREHCKREGLEL